jgi:hypothetical protein
MGDLFESQFSLPKDFHGKRERNLLDMELQQMFGAKGENP